MKKAVLTALLMLTSVSSFAETLKLKCGLSQDARVVQTMNTFSGQMTLMVQEDGATFGDLVVSTRRQGRDSQYQLLVIEEMAGQRQIIPAGKLVKTEAINFKLYSEGEKQVQAALNLTLNLAQANALLEASDGIQYKSLCVVESREE